jgi:hypothetical protein
MAGFHLISILIFHNLCLKTKDDAPKLRLFFFLYRHSETDEFRFCSYVEYVIKCSQSIASFCSFVTAFGTLIIDDTLQEHLTILFSKSLFVCSTISFRMNGNNGFAVSK